MNLTADIPLAGTLDWWLLDQGTQTSAAQPQAAFADRHKKRKVNAVVSRPLRIRQKRSIREMATTWVQPQPVPANGAYAPGVGRGEEQDPGPRRRAAPPPADRGREGGGSKGLNFALQVTQPGMI